MDAGPSHSYQHDQSASLYAKGKLYGSCAMHGQRLLTAAH